MKDVRKKTSLMLVVAVLITGTALADFDDWAMIDDFESYSTGNLSAGVAHPWRSVDNTTSHVKIVNRWEPGIGNAIEWQSPYNADGMGAWIDLQRKDGNGDLYRPEAIGIIEQGDRFLLTFDVMGRDALANLYSMGLFREGRGWPTYNANSQTMAVRTVMGQDGNNNRFGYVNDDGAITWSSIQMNHGWWGRAILDIDQANKTVDVYFWSDLVNQPRYDYEFLSPADILADPDAYRFVTGASWTRPDMAWNEDSDLLTAFGTSARATTTAGSSRAYIDNIYVAVPEPATLMILSLGGLMLRKRK